MPGTVGTSMSSSVSTEPNLNRGHVLDLGGRLINRHRLAIPMDSEITFRSAYGSIVYISMILLLLIFAVLMFVLPSIDLILVVFLIILEAFVALTPFMLRYTFDDEKVTVSNPLAVPEPPAYYDRIWKVEDSRKEYASNMHGASPDSIRIWYDRGTGHYICISPSDKRRAMGILRDRCPDAEFTSGGDAGS